jgi:uncharacterized membrane protein
VDAFLPLLVVHIAAGTTALLSGPIPMLSAKGQTLHRRAGLVYAAAMAVTTVAGLVLALLRDDLLLMVIAVFSFFLVFNGIRAIRRLRGRKHDWLDLGLAVATLVFSLGLFLWGLNLQGSGGPRWTALFFGVLGSFLALQQLRRLRADESVDWLKVHLSSMGGGYIATVTAFLVVNVHFLPGTVVFVAPTLVGSVLIGRAARKYGRLNPA